MTLSVLMSGVWLSCKMLFMQENCTDFENSRWFNSLLPYGDTTDNSVDDLDLKLIPSIVEKVLLAKLTGKMCDFQLQFTKKVLYAVDV